MHLRALLVVALVSVAAVACGPTVSDVCTDFAQVWCDQHYACASGADLATLQSKYGSDTTTCAKNFAALEGCANTNQLLCPVGKGYDTGRAQQCTTEYQALTCDQVENNTALADCDLANYICH